MSDEETKREAKRKDCLSGLDGSRLEIRFATPGGHHAMTTTNEDLSENPKSKRSRKGPSVQSSFARWTAIADERRESGERALFSQCTPFMTITRREKKEWPEPRPGVWAYREQGQDHKRQLDRLLSRALHDGDSRAVDLLLRLAWGAVSALDTLARDRPEVLRPFARDQIMWPAFIGKKRALSGTKRDGPPSLNEWLIHTIELGKDSPHRGQWNPHSLATAQAIVMHHWLAENQGALNLPDLTKATLDCWFKIGQ